MTPAELLQALTRLTDQAAPDATVWFDGRAYNLGMMGVTGVKVDADGDIVLLTRGADA